LRFVNSPATYGHDAELNGCYVRKHSLCDPHQPTGYEHKNKNQLKTIAAFGVKLNYNVLLALPCASRKLAKKKPGARPGKLEGDY
jgi:hypothetical protein